MSSNPHRPFDASGPDTGGLSLPPGERVVGSALAAVAMGAVVGAGMGSAASAPDPKPSAPTTRLGTTSAALQAWIKQLAPRERVAVVVGALVLGAALFYWLAIRPAWTMVRESPKRMAELDQQLQSMQVMAVDSKALRGTPRLAPTQAASALKSVTDPLGAVARLNVAGDRATVTFTNATGEQVRRWMVDARATARAKAVEATLSRTNTGLSGTVVVALPTS